MTDRELREFMHIQGAYGEKDLENDQSYAHPSREWFLGPFASAVVANARAMGLAQYSAESNDCDKFTRRASQLARDCHALTSPGSKDGLAVGDFVYIPGSTGDAFTDAGKASHAIVCAVVYEDGKPELIFMEPQNGLELKLTTEEIGSCYAFIF